MTDKLQELLPEKSFVSLSHFHGIVCQYNGNDILFYQDAWGENDSGFMKITRDDLWDDLVTSEVVEIDTRAIN
jgi:hypothetical protein